MGDERNTVMYGKRPVSFPGDYCSPSYPLRGVIYPFVPPPVSMPILLTAEGAVLIERGGEAQLVMGCCACHRGAVIRQTLCATQ